MRKTKLLKAFKNQTNGYLMVTLIEWTYLISHHIIFHKSIKKSSLSLSEFLGMMNPVQMRPADVEKRAERRLFIGMLPITCDEYNLRNIFEQFGKIQEVQVLRNSNGTSRRCAFLTFSW